jgi:glycosyltransferase involved in cell wall biosynthesis
MSTAEPHVLQATAWYPPYHLGGTEVYLESLVAELAALGIRSTALVPRTPGVPGIYRHAGAAVETYPVNEVPFPNEMKDGKPHTGFEDFLNRLRAHPAAIYHQHSWTRGCGSHHLRAAREMGFRTVLTVHVPGNICLRGTMLKFGKTPCGGRVEQRACGACWAEGKGMPTLLAKGVSRLPIGVAQRASRGSSRVATALSARALGAGRLKQLREMAANADRIIAVCQWLYDALKCNGVPEEQLVLSRQGVSPSYREAARGLGKRQEHRGPLRLLFLGRWDPVKGIDVAVRAVRSLPLNANVRLSVRAVPAAADKGAYETAVRTLAGNDPRIMFGPPVPRSEIAAVMAEHDVLAVPSVWQETGPLVVLEAQASGLYVLGSRLGGIAELVDETNGGELVDAGNAAAWAKSIERLAVVHAKGGLRSSLKPVRTMDAAAADMAETYRSIGLEY